MFLRFVSPLITSVLMSSHVHAAVLGPASGPVGGSQPATVLEVNHGGVGHVNLVPYFSVHSNFVTHLHLANTDTRNGKAVKVRFRSAINGEDLGSFTLLLAPGDMLAFAMTHDADTGYARLIHNDASCTLPSDVRGPLGPVFDPWDANGTAERPEMTREGSVEIITLADIPPLTAEGAASPLFTAIAHGAGAAAPNCDASVLHTLSIDSSSYADARSKGLDVPTSGLMTQWILINVPYGVGYAGRATAVEARVASGGVPGYANMVLFPQTAVRVTDRDRTAAYTTQPLLLYGGAEGTQRGYAENQMPDLSTPYLPSGLSQTLSVGTAPRLQAFAISQALATSSIGGEVLIEPSIAAATDWVVTMPTLYLQAGFRNFNDFPMIGTLRVTDLTVNEAGQRISGTKNFFQRGANLDQEAFPICVMGVDATANGTPPASQPYNETTFRSYEGTAFSMRLTPPEPGHTLGPESKFCGQTSFIRFLNLGDQNGSGPLGDVRSSGRPSNLQKLYAASTGSWGRIHTPGVDGIGLPIIGFTAVELYNGSVAPVISGFGLTYPLTTTKP